MDIETTVNGVCLERAGKAVLPVLLNADIFQREPANLMGINFDQFLPAVTRTPRFLPGQYAFSACFI